MLFKISFSLEQMKSVSRFIAIILAKDNDSPY